ncbi:alpha/beta fold hydrolase [Nonomuraea sp. NPDC052116]|uniref:alpha/beta fold hydrolase n=1 Tax=Nonomuraea sp. NPDC052116 TaxID=3155665 RepID=UPI003429CAB4
MSEQPVIVLVGHSYGGMVITEAAAGHPAVRALVYVAADKFHHQFCADVDAGASHAIAAPQPDAVTAAVLDAVGHVRG